MENEFSTAFSTAFDPEPQESELATPADVAARLGRPLTPEEEATVDGQIDEASALVIGYLGCDPSDPGPVPAAVTIVTSRMVARAIQQAEADITPGQQAQTDTAGPFSRTRQYYAGANAGGPWLSAGDKTALRPYRCDGKAYSIDTAPGYGTIHADICSANQYRQAPYWYAGWCTCGADIAGRPIYEGV